MHLRLSGWQRIGIVASVLWMLVSCIVGLSTENGLSHARFYQIARTCNQSSNYDSYSRCMEKGLVQEPVRRGDVGICRGYFAGAHGSRLGVSLRASGSVALDKKGL